MKGFVVKRLEWKIFEKNGKGNYKKKKSGIKIVYNHQELEDLHNFLGEEIEGKFDCKYEIREIKLQ